MKYLFSLSLRWFLPAFTFAILACLLIALTLWRNLEEMTDTERRLQEQLTQRLLNEERFIRHLLSTNEHELVADGISRLGNAINVDFYAIVDNESKVLFANHTNAEGQLLASVESSFNYTHLQLASDERTLKTAFDTDNHYFLAYQPIIIEHDPVAVLVLKYNLGSIREESRDRAISIILTELAITLLVATVLFAVLYRWYTLPLIQLQQAVRRISLGDMEDPIQIGGWSELNDLGADIERMQNARKTAEDALREKDVLLTESQRIAHIGSWRYDVQTDRISWSDENYRIYGVHPDSFDLTEENFFQLIHPEDLETVKHALTTFKAGATVSDTEFRIVRPSGVIRTLRGRSEMIPFKGAEPAYIVGTNQDITAIIDADERFRNSFRRIPLPLTLQENLGELADCNDAFCELTGYSREEILRVDTTSLGFLAEPNQRDEIIEELRREGEVNDFEMKIRHRSGEVRIIQMSLRYINHDNHSLLLSVAHEITNLRKAEDALQVTKGQLQIFIANSPVSLAMFDKDMRYLHVSRQWTLDYQLENRDILGESHYSIFPEIPDNWKKIHQRGLSGEVIRADEDSFERYDGQVQWLRWEVRPWFENEGKVGGILIFTEDITVRKQAELALAVRVEEQEAVAELGKLALSDAPMQQVYDNAIERMAAIYNVQSCSVLELQPDNKTVKLVSNIGWEKARTTTDTVELKHAPLTEYTLRIQQAVIVSNFKDETRFTVSEQLRNHKLISGMTVVIGNTNKPFGVLGVYSHTEKAFTQEDSNFAQAIANVLAEATERRRVESALRLSDQRARAIFDQSYAFVGLLNPDGILLDVNRTSCEFTGIAKEEAIGQPFPQTIWWSHNLQQRKRLEESISKAAKGEFIHFESEHLSKEGTLHIFDFSLKPVKDVSGKVVWLIPESRDITERKKSESTIQQSLREKEALLKEVHHRVKNNLQVITSLLSLEGSRTKNEVTKLALSEMKGRLRSMALLHETLYRSGIFATVKLGRYLSELATQAFRSMTTLPEGIALEFDFDSSELELDQALPCGLLVNELISNSLKHGFPEGRGGAVKISLHQLDNKMTIQVADTGIGLPDDFALDKHQSLGLQLVSDLVYQLHGALEFASENGTVFTVTFTPQNKQA